MSSGPAASRKILRVGVIQGGKIIEERHLRSQDDVTVGPDARNTFVLPASGLPRSFPVLQRRGDGYHLLFTEQMSGRVRLGSSDADFAGLRANGMAKRRGNVFALPLSEEARGKVLLGDVTLLFQFVSPPPAPARLRLPDDIRGSVWKSIDHLFFGIFVASLLLHCSGAALIALSPKPVDADLSLDELPDRFARMFVPPKPPEPEQVKEEPPPDEAKKTEKREAKQDKPPENAEQRKQVIAQRVSQKGLLKLLGSAGAGGALHDLLGAGTGAGDVAAALSGAQGVRIAGGSGTETGPRGGGTGRAEGIGELGTSGGGNVTLARKSDAQVSAKVMAAAPEVDSADVDRDALARFIRARLGAIRGCYERELKRNPGLKGKVVVRFNITPAGRAGDVRLEENSVGEEVGRCIGGLIHGWVFPFKPSDEVPVQYPFVFSAGN